MCTIACAIDTYIDLHAKETDSGATISIDPRLTQIVERMFTRCFQDGELEQVPLSIR